uniref:Allophanate hydrolase n=1 Tax=Talaromyces marneffei PM1 TaxID=1077442 RepID=A0A093V3X6_TALMA
MVAAQSIKRIASGVEDNGVVSFEAQPYAFRFNPSTTALLIIDMQRDFLLKDGFGYIQAGDAGVEKVQATIKPTLAVLRMFRECGIHVIHTREGHRPDLRDLPTPKLLRQAHAPESRHSMVIGDVGPMGRLLTRGEYGHDIIDELQPVTGEYVVDKPGKGSFFSTTLHEHLVDRGITHLIVAGVTVECCVTTTVREGNDRGFDACILSDCTDGFVPTFKSASLDMIHFSEGLFGFVSESQPLLAALSSLPADSSKSARDWDGSMSIESLKSAYSGGLSPVTVVKYVLETISADKSNHSAVWLNLSSTKDLLHRAESLEQLGDRNLPLFGVPFAVKDNIDVAGLPTTAACPEFEYVPEKSAFVIRKLEAAGAIVIGKTNLDQFATGLVGTRSPYGACHCALDPTRVSGGSSSGSAVAVALGQVAFALGTDTAGSGRIPASFNNIIGLKPTKGTISTTGVIPACRTLDCVSFFANTISDARTVWLAAKEHDPEDPYSRSSPSLASLNSRSILHEESTYTVSFPPIGILESALSPAYNKQFVKVASLVRSLDNVEEINFDWSSYLSASDLLYKSAFVAERTAALQEVLNSKAKKITLHPVTQQVLDLAGSKSATDAFRDIYEAQRLLKAIEAGFDKCDILVVPTAPNHPTIAEVEQDPIGPNLKLGYFASAVNVLDLAAVAIPAGHIEGLPFGISIIAPAFKEAVYKTSDHSNAVMSKHFAATLHTSRRLSTRARWRPFYICSRYLSTTSEPALFRQLEDGTDINGIVGCVKILKLLEGDHNKVLLLTMSNGDELIARLPNPNAGGNYFTVASEIATRRFVQSICDVPSPTVWDWDFRYRNTVGAEWIIEAKAAGEPLRKHWFSLSRRAQLGIIDQVAEIEGKLASLKFSSHGSIYMARWLARKRLFCTKMTSPNTMLNKYDALAVQPEQLYRQYAIGPSTDRRLYRGPGDLSKQFRGPFTDLLHYAKALSRNERRYLLNNPWAKENHITSTKHQQDPSEYLELIFKYDALQRRMIQPEFNNDPCTLSHPNLSLDNIFIDATTTKIVCLTGWQSAVVAPPLLKRPYPTFLDSEFQTQSEDRSQPLPKERYRELVRESDPLRYKRIFSNPREYEVLIGPMSSIFGAWDNHGIFSLRESLVSAHKSERINIIKSLQESEQLNPQELRNHAKEKYARQELGLLFNMTQNVQETGQIPIDGRVPTEAFERAQELSERYRQQYINLAAGNKGRMALHGKTWPFDSAAEGDVEKGASVSDTYSGVFFPVRKHPSTSKRDFVRRVYVD